MSKRSWTNSNSWLKESSRLYCKESIENDVDRLSTVDSLKAQLQYHKIVLGRKGLTVTGDKRQMIFRLKTFLQSEGPKSPLKEKHEISHFESDEGDKENDEVGGGEEEGIVSVIERFSFEDKSHGL